MSNPYASPSFDPEKFKDIPPAYGPAPGNSLSMVTQVRIVAILNAVQGGLEIPMGLLTMSMGILLPVMMQMQASNPNFKQPGGAPPKQMLWVMTVMYLVMGTPTLLGGILRIVAGIQTFRFKGRTLGFVSLILGMASVLSCYCAPTAIAILVYGLIIYLNPAVTAAFKMGQEGKSGDAILAAFSPYGPMPMGR